VTSVVIVAVALGVNGPNRDANGLFGEPPNEPVRINLGPNPLASMNQQFESVLNTAFAFAGNQAFLTVMCEMRNPDKDYTKAIIWLNAVAIPLYVIIGCVVYNFSGQYVVAPALGSAPGVPSKVAYGILIPTMLGSGLVFGQVGIKFMYHCTMDTMIKPKAKLTDNTFLTWGVWLGCGTLFWVVAFILANSIPAFNTILGISSALFVTWYEEHPQMKPTISEFPANSIQVHIRPGKRAVDLPQLGPAVFYLAEVSPRHLQLVHVLRYVKFKKRLTSFSSRNSS
jgi:amino acid transporter